MMERPRRQFQRARSLKPEADHTEIDIEASVHQQLHVQICGQPCVPTSLQIWLSIPQFCIIIPGNSLLTSLTNWQYIFLRTYKSTNLCPNLWTNLCVIVRISFLPLDMIKDRALVRDVNEEFPGIITQNCGIDRQAYRLMGKQVCT
jgi:hypothetical protein